MSHDINLATVTTSEEFGRALTAVRLQAGLSIRDVAVAVNLSSSTIGGYFSGSHLPTLKLVGELPRILAACGVTEPSVVEAWRAAWQRARGSRGARLNGGAGTGGDDLIAAQAAADSLTITPPFGRLDSLRALRGRDAIVAHLTSQLPLDEDGEASDRPVRAQGDGAAVVQVLHGLGGVGKSTVALAVAARARELGMRTWWCTATGQGSVPAAMRALAVELGATVDQLAGGNLSDLLWRLLDGLDERWLLVFDNADDPHTDLGPSDGSVLDGTGWLRPVTSRRGVVVVTTRDGAAWANDGTRRAPSWLAIHRLRPLDAGDAGQALRDIAGDEAGSPAAAESLARRLGGLPLALRVAGQYLAEVARMPTALGDAQVPHGYAAYERALRTGRPDSVLPGLDAVGPAGGDGAARGPGRVQERALVGPTWELSLRLLAEQRRSLARPLLTLLGCLGGDAIDVELLDAPVLAANPLFPGLTATGLWSLLTALDGHGLIDLTGTGTDRLLWLHPLVRDSFARAAHDSGRIGDYLEAVTALLARAARLGDPRDPDTWPRWARLRGHADAGLALLRTRRAWRLGALPVAQLPPDLLVPAIQAARYLRASGRLTEAAAMYDAVLAAGRGPFGDDHTDMLAAAHDLYRVRAAQGRTEDAERGLRIVLDERARILGTTHPDTLTTQHYLARTLRDLGQLREALGLLTRTLASREELLGPRHRDTLTSRNNVADVLVDMEHWDEAGRTLLAVWSDRTALLGAEHPATLVTLYHLARLDFRQREYERAAGRADELVSRCQRVLGPDHPRTLEAIGLRGEIIRELGGLADARDELADALERSRQVLGTRHATTRVLQRLTESDDAA